jgi:glycosyltransferase involved in cell wall biosynthesis
LKKNKSCVIFSTADWDAQYWTNKQHNALEFAKNDHIVLYIESIGIRSPGFNNADLKRILKRFKKAIFILKKVQPNIFVLSPIAIPFNHGHWLIKFFNQKILGFYIFLVTKYLKLDRPLIWTYHPYMLSALEYFRKSQLIYHCVDDLSGIPRIDKSFCIEETKLIEKSDIVFVTSQTLLERSISINPNSYYFSNVADIKHFKTSRYNIQLPREYDQIKTPRIGYVGALSDYKIDFNLLLKIVDMRPDWSWVLIGSEIEGQSNPTVAELFNKKNVYFLGDKPYDQLPKYLSGFDVGLLPQLINQYTDSMFPMKLYEYLAAGVPVVSSKLKIFSNDIPGVLVVESSEFSFVGAIEKQLVRGRFKDSELMEYLEDKTWSSRWNKMMELINIKSKINLPKER